MPDDCRHIDSTEVNEILLTGEVNYRNRTSLPSGSKICIEGNTHDGSKRIVFANQQRTSGRYGD
jgi:hypothetical protein